MLLFCCVMRWILYPGICLLAKVVTVILIILQSQLVFAFTIIIITFRGLRNGASLLTIENYHEAAIYPSSHLMSHRNFRYSRVRQCKSLRIRNGVLILTSSSGSIDRQLNIINSFKLMYLAMMRYIIRETISFQAQKTPLTFFKGHLVAKADDLL